MSRRLSLLSRALLALLRRDARAGFLGLRFAEPSGDPSRDLACAIAHSYGASAGERRVLPRLAEELLLTGVAEVRDGGVYLRREADAKRDPSARKQKNRMAGAAADERSARDRRETDARTPTSARIDSVMAHAAAAVVKTAGSAAALARETDARTDASARIDCTTPRRDTPDDPPKGSGGHSVASDRLSARIRSGSSLGTAHAKEMEKEKKESESLSSGESSWTRVPERVAERLAQRSGGKIVLAVLGRDEGLSALLADLTEDRPRFAEELDRWALLVAEGRDSWWLHGERSRERLLGRRDPQTGLYAAAGLRRCLEEARASIYREEASRRAPSVPAKPPSEPRSTPREQAVKASPAMRFAAQALREEARRRAEAEREASASAAIAERGVRA